MEVSLRLDRRQALRLLWLLAAFELALVLAYFLGQLTGKSIRLLNLDGEQSIATWFSSTQLFVIGLLLLLKAAHRQPIRDPSRPLLLLAAAAFAFLSLDEAVSFHESITRALSHISALPRFHGDHGMWIPIYLGIVALALVLGLPQIGRMWTWHRRPLLLMLSGAAVLLAGAVGLEIVAYEIIADSSSPWHPLEVASEEFLEMFGASLMLYGCVLFNLQPAMVRQEAVAPPSLQIPAAPA